MAVELRRAGLHVTGTALWLDARRKSELSFVSHAHSDHIARHERVIATAPTLRMMSERLGKLPAALPAPYNRGFELGPLYLELLPAGHMLGSAQLRVTRADGVRVAYTGDLNLAPSLTAEPAQVAECDTLVIESTFGHPRYAFPPREEVLAQVEAWIRAALERKVTPILVGYAFGKSQEVMKFLSGRGFSLVVDPKIHVATEIYREYGVAIDRVRRYDGTWTFGEVGVFPPGKHRQLPANVTGPRTSAALTGWAMDPGAARKYGADVAFPLSDHADCKSLVKYAKQTGASEVLTTHGFAEELAAELRRAGVDARPVGTIQQLELF